MRAASRVLTSAILSLALPLVWPAVRLHAQSGTTAAPDNCGQAPGTPTDLTVTVNGTTVVAAWRAASGGCPATSYEIEAGSLPGLSDFPSVPVANAATTITLVEVLDGLYHVRVRAINAAGISEPSNEARVKVGCGASPPTPKGVFAAVSGTTLSIIWNTAGPAVSAYLVDIGPSPVAAAKVSEWIETSEPALTVTVTPGIHSIRVRARSACGSIGPPSRDIIVATGGRSGVPDVVVVRRTADRSPYFPTVERLRNGHLVVVYYDSPEHVSTKGRISLVKSLDGGRTWSSPKVAVDSPLDDRDPSVMETAKGTLLLSYFSPPSPGLSDPPGVFVARSDDEGETWSASVKVETAFGSPATSAKIVELENGNLLIPIYGSTTDLARSAIVRSTDGGRTWPKEFEVQIRSASRRDLVEPALGNVGAGRLMVVMRAEQPNGAAMESRSSDGGRTWSEPRGTDVLAQASDLLPVRLGPDGKAAVVHTWGDWSRRFGDSRATVMQLIEWPERGGLVHGYPRVVYNSHCDDAAQPSSVLLDGERLFTVYYDACAGYVGGTFSTIDTLRR